MFKKLFCLVWVGVTCLIGENFNSLEIRFNKNIESEKNLKADLV